MQKKIYIKSFASISSLGISSDEVWDNYCHNKSQITFQKIGNKEVCASSLSKKEKVAIENLKNSDIKYKSLDNSVLYAIYASRQAIKKANWSEKDVFGINIGSSRGATELFEKYHEEFLKSGKTPTLTSPTTTLGNISTWVAHDLKSSGPEISHSITCSTALHALLNGVAWLRAEMAEKFLVGGSEAPLTTFTIAQMQALKIYANDNSEYPCQSLNLDKKSNTLVLGEGAAVICLDKNPKKAICFIEGMGYATDDLQHNISISEEAECFQKSMEMALKNVLLSDVDVIVMHAPGTIKGDLSEFKAIEKLFGANLPMLTSNKWKIGHTFGASGMLSIELAILMLQNQKFIGVPFVKSPETKSSIKKVLINAVGFGGNAVSVLLSL